MSFIINPFVFGGGGAADFDETNLFSRVRGEGLTNGGSPFSDTDPIPNCDDLSGNGNDWGQASSGQRPIYRTNQINGKAAIRFNSANSTYLGGPFFTALSECEFFIVVKADADPAASGGSSGSWRLNPATDTNAAATYPFTDNNIYESAFLDTSVDARVTVNPTPSLAAWRLYGVQAKSGTNNYLIRLDGTTIATATKSPVFNWQGSIGASTGPAILTNYMNGYVAEYFFLTATAGTPQRESIRDYVNSFYGLSTV